MIDLYELKQLAAFDELGTLRRVAQKFHTSTPSVSRSMQHLEEAFAVSLFIRGKNKIELNEAGKLAAEYAHKLSQEVEQAVQHVRDFDQRQKTIVIKSCAPAPLWELQRLLNTQYPAMTISAAICQNEEVLAAWRDGSCDIAILPFSLDNAKPFMKENLFVCVPPDHALAAHHQLTYAAINGFNFLLRTELGFWDTLCRKKMPASRFLVQTDAAVFDELVNASSLPCFVTNYKPVQESFPDRVRIPLTDAEAQITFYLLARSQLKLSYSLAAGMQAALSHQL